MTQFACLNADGDVDSLLEADGAPEAAEFSFVEIDPPVARVPDPPFAGARLTVAAGALSWRDPRTLAQAKAAAWARVKVARDDAEIAPFEHGSLVFDADAARIGNAVVAALLADKFGQAYTVEWTLADNSTVTLDGGQMMAVGSALAQRVKDVFETGVALRAVIDSVAAGPTANTQLDAINWPE